MLPAIAICAALTVAEKPRTRNVAIVLYQGAEVLDFAGPTEVFEAAGYQGAVRGQPAFRVYTVAKSKAPIVSQHVVTIIPEFSIDDAPASDLIVIPGGDIAPLKDDPKMMAWIERSTRSAEITMSVCTGAFVLGKAGLLDGHTATTWYGAIERLRKENPKADVQEGRRLVDAGRVVTTAGVSAGIDGSLHVVARLLGRVVADRTARYMEYHWTPEAYLARSYPLFNPSLDETGRALQQARLLEEEKNWPEAVKTYRALADSKNGYAWHRLAFALWNSGDHKGAIAAGRRASEFPDIRPDALVNLACYYAVDGHRDEALTALEQAVAAGFKEKWRFTGDEDLASLHNEPRFLKLVEKL